MSTTAAHVHLEVVTPSDYGSCCPCRRYELLDQGIKVVLIKPGPVRTSLWEDLDHAKHYDTSSVLTTPEMDKLYGKDYAAVS